MDKAASHNWAMRGLYAALAFCVLFLHLLPLDAQPDRWPFPDVLIALTFAWVLRRPDYVPTLLVAVVMLMADLLLQRPPGLLAALVVFGSAYLRSAAPGMKDAGFVGEWMSVSVVIAGVFFANRIVLSILSVQQAALLPVMIQLVLTIACYPVIVALSQSVFGVRRMTVSDTGAEGGRA
ncbi:MULTISPECIES: rod shape-determining protein MreD [unclassified Ruegeria]|uniref:rod shape-determining protein MreD n=1 Tax=unclassified Ruegeria TaxID=2625375 RepID=UPI001493258A|nr:MULTISPECIES: rod shape-determining protein MreD [unclassified Ruegeria]NOD89334.1 rod shape-determining protein MreD [Ruegeria sp. HKCCD4318]NOE13503.1 rod shape-determining protein MreD [Ruegeria sp. HKCCD4318-2]NOG07748.1 rod shape-determining protein MreD [Ruegeria sp. HKCCD4315]